MNKTDAEMKMEANIIRVEVLDFIKEHEKREGVSPTVDFVVQAILDKHSDIQGEDAEWVRELAKMFIRDCATEFLAADQSSDEVQKSRDCISPFLLFLTSLKYFI